MTITIIAISGKQLVGKDLLTKLLLEELAELGFSQFPIALGIKQEFSRTYGLTLGEIEDSKAMYRQSLIAMGQRRRMQDINYWLRCVMQDTRPKIVSDLRLSHEYDFFKQKGAFLIRMEANEETRAARGTLVATDDPTECELDTIKSWDAVIENNGTVDDLKKQAKALAQKIKTLQAA